MERIENNMGTLAIRIEKEDINAKNIRKHYPDKWGQYVLLNTTNATFRFETQRKIIWAESRDFLEQATTAGFNAQKKQWAKEYAASECNQHFFIDEIEVPKEIFLDVIDGKFKIGNNKVNRKEYVLFNRLKGTYLHIEFDHETGTWKNSFSQIYDPWYASTFDLEDSIRMKKEIESTCKYKILILEKTVTMETTKIIEA